MEPSEMEQHEKQTICTKMDIEEKSIESEKIFNVLHLDQIVQGKIPPTYFF